MASAFSAVGLKPGDRLCILQRNSIDSLLLIFAASRIGVVAVPINYRMAPAEWVECVRDANAVAILADAEYCEAFDAALGASPLDAALVKLAATGATSGWQAYDALVDEAPVEPLSSTRQAAENDIVLQMYTSGTTGRPKGAMLSHRSLVANVEQNLLGWPHRTNPGERALVTLPLFHIAAITTCLCTVATGACLVIHRDVDPKAIVDALQHDDIAVTTLVPAVIQAILAGIPSDREMRFPALKYLAYGASPISRPVLVRALEVFKCAFVQGYGMTETSGCITMLTEDDHHRATNGRADLLLSAGKPLAGTEVRIAGEDGADAPVGAIGEILVRGTQVLSGYWKLPEASAEALADGWLHTGDVGYLDEEGYLFLRDRLKDMIVSGAENIYPAEIEAVLIDHPAVADICVIGVPDARWGETVMAIVVAAPECELTPEELDAFCRLRLGGFKVPKRYEFIDALPRNASGKVLKKDLRQRHWQGQHRSIA